MHLNRHVDTFARVTEWTPYKAKQECTAYIVTLYSEERRIRQQQAHASHMQLVYDQILQWMKFKALRKAQKIRSEGNHIRENQLWEEKKRRGAFRWNQKFSGA